MLIAVFSLLANVYCILCLFLIEELRSLEFFLINLQCVMELLGSMTEFMVSLASSLHGYYVFNCNNGRINADYYDNYHFYKMIRLVKHDKKNGIHLKLFL